MLDWPARQQNYESEYDYYSRIFRWAMNHFIYESDDEVWHEPDHWVSGIEIEELCLKNNGKLTGDCDDFAQLCRHALAHAGVSSRLVMCVIEDGVGLHCVAESPDGWVFDNRQTSPTSWAYLISTNYQKGKFGPLVLANQPMLEDIPWHLEIPDSAKDKGN